MNTDNSESQNNEPVNMEESSDDVNARFDSLETATKSYQNLQKKFGEQSTELGELRKVAEEAKQLKEKQLAIVKNYGFDSVEAYERHQFEQQNNLKLAGFEADEYAQYLEECDYPDEMRNLLMSYKQNPSQELLNAIEAEFSVDTVKKVAGSMAMIRGQLQAQEQQALQQQAYDSAKQYLSDNVAKYSEEFKNPEFAKMYGEAFKALGTNLQTDTFVNLMRNYAKSIITQYETSKGIAHENNESIDRLVSSSNINSSNGHSEKNILDMTEAEMRAELRKYN